MSKWLYRIGECGQAGIQALEQMAERNQSIRFWERLCWQLARVGWLCFGLAGVCRADGGPTAFTLSNGMHLLVTERHTGPLVAVSLWVRAGAREERKDEIGCAHFLEHTLFKGTTTRRAGDADIAIENLGAVLDAATGPDYAHFYTTVSGIHLAAALEIVSDTVRNAILPAEELERERGVILDELAQHAADPTAHLIDLLYAESYLTHPYLRSPGGTPEAIRALRRETLIGFYHRCYMPARCTLVLVGDCTPDEARDATMRAFGGWNTNVANDAIAKIGGRPLTPPAHGVGEWPDMATAHTARARAPVPYGTVGLAFPAPPAGDTQLACAGMVAAMLLGDARRAGRLNIPALAGTDAAARYIPRQETGLFLLTARAAPESKREGHPDLLPVEAALRKAIRDLLMDPPTAEEFNAARRLILGRLQFDTETDAGLARSLGYAVTVSGDPPDTLRARLYNLSRADLRRFCALYLNLDRCISVQLLPSMDAT
jgi:zinc protease